MTAPRPASAATSRRNAAELDALPFADDTDFENARRGLIVAASGQVMADAGHVAWDFDRWAFLDGDAPPTARTRASGARASSTRSPASSRSREGIYQARGFDLAVASFLRTDTGWVVVDPAGHRGDDAGRVRPGARARRRPAGGGRDPHAQPRRPLRRRAGGGQRRGPRGGPGADHRPGRLPRGVGQRERPPGQRHVPTGLVHVRQPRRARPAGRASAPGSRS